MLKRLSWKDCNGFTLVEILVTVAILAIIAAIAIPAAVKHRKSAHLSAIQSECRTLHSRFELYFLEHLQYPETMDLTNFTPVDFSGNMLSMTLNHQVDAYASPDDQGQNQEFWLQLSYIADPSYKFIVANSDNTPLEPGIALNGNFRYVNGIRHQ